MTEPPSRPTDDREAARRARLREALRENLKRRKSQLRGRAEATHAAAGPVDADGDAAADDDGPATDPAS
jgi:hypothetical protein